MFSAVPVICCMKLPANTAGSASSLSAASGMNRLHPDLLILLSTSPGFLGYHSLTKQGISYPPGCVHAEPRTIWLVLPQSTSHEYDKHLMPPQQLHLFPTDPSLLQCPQNPQQSVLSCFLPPKPAGWRAAGAPGSLCMVGECQAPAVALPGTETPTVPTPAASGVPK